MADGLLGPIDPTAFQGLLGQLQPILDALGPSDKEKAQARAMALMQAGFGIMGGRRGYELQNAGQALGGAVQGYQGDLQNIAKQKMTALSMTDQLDKLAQSAQYRQQQNDFQKQFPTGLGGAQTLAAQGQAPQVQPQPQTPQEPQQGMDVPVNAPQSALQSPQSPQSPTQVPAQQQPTNGVATKRQVAQRYQDIGDWWSGQQGQLAAQKADQYYKLSQSMMPQVKEQKVLTQNGQRVVVNLYNDGSQEVVPYAPDQEDVGMQNIGGKTLVYDKKSGEMKGSYENSQSPDSAAGNQVSMRGQNMSAQTAANSLAEQTRYHNLEMGMDTSGNPSNIDGVATAIANYQQPPLSSFAMAKPYGGTIMAKVMEINPNYDAKNYGTAQQTANAFAKGGQGNTVRSINVAMQHIDTLGQAVDALNNGNIQVFNKIGNFVAQQTGQPAPTNFNAVKDIVSNEITKAIIGSGGGVGDRDKAQAALKDANSPAQLKTVMDSYKNLFVGQLGGLRQQYQANTQRNDFDKFLSPEVQTMVKAKTAGSSPTNNAIRSQADAILLNGNR